MEVFLLPPADYLAGGLHIMHLILTNDFGFGIAQCGFYICDFRFEKKVGNLRL